MRKAITVFVAPQIVNFDKHTATRLLNLRNQLKDTRDDRGSYHNVVPGFGTVMMMYKEQTHNGVKLGVADDYKLIKALVSLNGCKSFKTPALLEKHTKARIADATSILKNERDTEPQVTA